MRHAGIRSCLVLLALVAAACSGGSSDETTPPGAPGSTADEPAAGAGTLIFEGEWIAGPHTVTADGAALVVNGRTLFSLGPTGAADPSTDADSDIADEPVPEAFRLAELAADAYATDASLETARDAIAGDAGLAEATIDGDELAITDVDGLLVHFRPTPPDAQARPTPSTDERAAALAATWQELLDDGGLVLVPSAGPTLTVAGDAATDLAADVRAALALDDGARRDTLLGLLTHESVVDELLAGPGPIADTNADAGPDTDSAPDPDDEDSMAPLAADGAVRFRSSGPAHARTQASRATPPAAPGQAAGISQTPGKPEGYVFATLVDGDSDGFTNALLKEGYKVWGYDSLDRSFGGRGFANFVATSGTGALYLATHGSPSGVSVESFADERAAGRTHTRLTRDLAAGDFSWWREGANNDGDWWLEISVQGIQNHWSSNNSIVHAAICNSNTLNAGFRAREYFSYQPTTTCAIATPDTQKLWQRMTGELGDGAFRPASVAFGQGGFSAGFRFDDGSPADDTVLSPGVQSFEEVDLLVGERAVITVEFDAYLDAAVPSDSILEVTGCIAKDGNASYEFDAGRFAVEIPVLAVSPGEGRVRFDAAATKSPSGIHLDGNQNPAGKNRVASNRDDYLGGATCRANPEPDDESFVDPDDGEEITTGGTPPVETPPAGDGATRVESETADTPEGKILVFYLDGVYYDAAGLSSVDAHEPFCSYLHVHGGPIEPVKPAGGPSISEHLGECGYGPPNFYLIDRP